MSPLAQPLATVPFCRKEPDPGDRPHPSPAWSPSEVLVIGETATSDQKTIPAQKPILEAVTENSHVVSDQVKTGRRNHVMSASKQ